MVDLRFGRGWGAFLLLLAVLVVVGLNQDAKPPSACASNWRECVDNADLVNNYLSDYKAQTACRNEAIKLAKYGNAQFPSLYYFSRFNSGGEYPKTGIVTLFENEAQFSNAFGAMVNSTIVCRYDLGQDRVLHVSIHPRS